MGSKHGMKVSDIEDGDSNKVIQRAEEITNNKSQHNIKIFPEVREDSATMHKDQEATVQKKKYWRTRKSF